MAPRGLTGSPVAALEPFCSSSLVKYPRGGGPQGRGGRQPPAPVVGSGQRRILCQPKGLSAHRPTPFGMSLQLGWFGGCLRRHKTARSSIIRPTAAQHLLHHADPSGVVVGFWAQIGRTVPEIGSGRLATGSPLAQDLARDMQLPRSGLLAAALRRLFVARGECVARGGPILGACGQIAWGGASEVTWPTFAFIQGGAGGRDCAVRIPLPAGAKGNENIRK